MKHEISIFIIRTTFTPVVALNIQIDFLHDEGADRFFSSNPNAKSAVEKAAKDLGDILTNNLHQINKDLYTWPNEGTSQTWNTNTEDNSWLGSDPGERKELTGLDLAFLRDLGYETYVQIPEPSTTLRLSLGALALFGSRSR